jgi:hypothetical protein
MRNMMCMENSLELRSVDVLRILMSFHEGIPPVGYRSRKLMRG